LASSLKTPAVLQLLEESFGANASYVESMLDRFLTDPSGIDDSWRSYFEGLVGRNGSTNGASTNGSNSAPTATKPAEQKPAATSTTGNVHPENVVKILGPSKRIVENMETSLGVPVATSLRYMPVKLLEENRKLINEYLGEQGKGKASFTHIIAYAIVQALNEMPHMNDSYAVQDGAPVRIKRQSVNLGIAIDMQKKDGSRSLLVPNIKGSNQMSFAEFLAAYDAIIKKARANKLDVADFADTTISLTNPGTIGTVGSIPRLMSGQSIIIATGAIEYPAEYQAMAPEALTQLGISKVVQMTSTYDHRIIQGAESGLLLARIHEFLLGKDEFYDKIFQSLRIPFKPFHWQLDRNPALLGMNREKEQMRKQAGVLELINAYRVRGHLVADIDPLHAIPLHHHPELDIETYSLTIWDLDREWSTGGLIGQETMTLRKIVETVRKAYCGTYGVEYRHIASREEKLWLRARLEAPQEELSLEVKKALLSKLTAAEQFEQFLHKNYIGQKRFSVEGSETVIAMLDQLIEGSTVRGVEDIFLGMAHRGRLTVLSTILGDYAERIFTAFEGLVHPSFPADEGDVKYHQGAKSIRKTAGGDISLTLSPNPSHLEFVDPVVEGMARAKQDLTGRPSDEAMDRIMPVLLHGDAAFAGQGIVMETLNLAALKGYRTGGTIHIIINNQIGFTTSPEASRSTIYSTDVAKMTQMPIFHVNGDDPEAAFRVLQLALDYRQQFHKDICIDVIGFRRLGHNEADEPSYTQPLMYQRVKAHKGVRTVYSNRLVREKSLTEAEVEEMVKAQNDHFQSILAKSKDYVKSSQQRTALPAQPLEEDWSHVLDTPVTPEIVKEITDTISIMPQNFHLNPKMVSQLTRRQKMGDGSTKMDWAFGESMAFGSLVKDGFSVRLSGQDSGRGTFSQRHATLYDTETGQPWIPLSSLKSDKEPLAQFSVWDSSLSEAGVLGFEYGYSVQAEKTLVLWEAQFGDFANGAQVIIDQFITPGEEKWQQKSRLTLLLPHGYEGQGPEHSSARLERFLQLCGENNIQVCYPTTPAQYFHLLRRQMHQQVAKPLVVMTPKSLLRLPAATSEISELTSGGFKPVIDDMFIADKSQVQRVVLCSGKVYYDLLERRTQLDEGRVALVRLEEFYPFPGKAMTEIVKSYPNAKDLIWAQEEPKNMGGWIFVKPRIINFLPDMPLRYVGRERSASPSTGFYVIHQLEQEKLMTEALTGL
jgi:multifunctional 2-oxoglutarate metabolism enzyme